MENIMPDNFRELVSGISVLLGFLFFFISLVFCFKNHALRISGILILFGLCLFANNAYCYFASIFIIATAITQIEFLENLVAILKGNKDFFEYKKELIPKAEVAKIKEKEYQEIENASLSEIKQEPLTQENKDIINLSFNKSNLTPAQYGMIAEEYVFNFLERKYGKVIERYVRVRDGSWVDFDGLLKLELKDIIFEIKSSRMGRIPLEILKSSVYRLSSAIKQKQYIFKNVELRFILVGNFSNEYKEKVLKLLKDDINSLGNQLYFEFYSFEEIGLSEILKNE